MTLLLVLISSGITFGMGWFCGVAWQEQRSRTKQLLDKAEEKEVEKL